MRFFHFILATITSILFGVAFYFVLVEHDLLMHFYFGLIGTVACLATHCWVFFYFIGTGEGIRDGVLSYQLDQISIKRTKKFKGKTFPFAFFSMIFMIVAAILGGALRFKEVHAWWHLGFVYFAIAFNLFTFYQEQRVIKENQELMVQLNQQIGATEPETT